MTQYVHDYEPALQYGALIQQDEIEGGGGSSTWYSGSPSGTKNGVNTVFTLPGTPTTNSLQLYLNGQFLTDGGEDYTLSGTTITMVNPPFSTDVFTYRYQ